LTLTNDKAQVDSEPEIKPRRLKTSTAIVIGAGLAELTAALELERRSAVGAHRDRTDPMENLFLVGRNCPHPDDRPDHSTFVVPR